MTQHTSIIDYTEAALTRRLEMHIATEQFDTAQLLSALLEGYIEGLWTVSWRGGEPHFNIKESDERALSRQLELEFPTEEHELDYDSADTRLDRPWPTDGPDEDTAGLIMYQWTDTQPSLVLGRDEEGPLDE
jgi:hypothetical protein